ERLGALRAGAWRLARQAESLRRAQAGARQEEVAAGADALRSQLDAAADAEAQREARGALAGKEKTLALLQELAASEGRCRLRLARLEATLEAACLTLRTATPSQHPPS